MQGSALPHVKVWRMRSCDNFREPFKYRTVCGSQPEKVTMSDYLELVKASATAEIGDPTKPVVNFAGFSAPNLSADEERNRFLYLISDRDADSALDWRTVDALQLLWTRIQRLEDLLKQAIQHG